jgi:hypothetical protein
MLLKITRTVAVIFCLSLACEASSAERAGQAKSEPSPKPAPAPVVVPVTVLSIIPAQAEPEARVTLSGTGFGENASVFLGSFEIPARISAARHAEFTIPPRTEAGIYALYLKRADGVFGRTYNFTVLPVRPVLSSLNPSRISSCAVGREREVTANGVNFSDSSLLFFDGAALPSTLVTSEAISFTLPSVPGGLHQVQVKNSPENGSVPLTMAIETKPEIGQVTIGSEYVNYYELIITGTNFNQNSSVYVDGAQIGGRGGQDMAEREKLIYVDCTRLIYQRHPYSPVKKDFRLQVVNSGGDGSQVITVSAP